MSNRSITGYHLNTFTIRISRRFSSAREFQMGNFQKYWSQNVGQDFIVLDFFVGGRSCGRKRCVLEINVSHAWDKALTRETPAKRGRFNRYALFMHFIFIVYCYLYFLYYKDVYIVLKCLFHYRTVDYMMTIQQLCMIYMCKLNNIIPETSHWSHSGWVVQTTGKQNTTTSRRW